MPVTAANIPPRGGFEKLLSLGGYAEVGTFEAWICAQCGFTEWYAQNVNEDLAKLAEEPRAGVLLIDGGAPPSPYR